MSDDDIKPIDHDDKKQDEETIAAPDAKELDKLMQYHEKKKKGKNDEDEVGADIDHDLVRYGTKVNRIELGEEIDLTEMDPALKVVHIGMGWDMRAFDKTPLDLDASVFLLDKNDKTRENEDFIFYNNTQDKVGSIKHKGDSRTGAGEGDDETIEINLQTLSYEVIKIVFVISIYDEDMLDHTFEDVKNVFFRMVNMDSEHELFRVEIPDDQLTKATGMVVAEMERVGPVWMFRALGTPIQNGLGEIASDYGIVVAEHVQA